MVMTAESQAEPRRIERRKHQRVGIMVPALLDQVPVTLSDISLGGIGTGKLEILFDSDQQALERGQRASLRFFDQDEVTDSIEIEIVRVSNSRGEIGARYVDLTEDQKRYIERKLNGEPVGGETEDGETADSEPGGFGKMRVELD